jgi:CRP-like cAMP-binding protein
MASDNRSQKIYNLLKTGNRSQYSKGQIIQSTESQRTMNFVTKGYVKRYLISSTGKLGIEVIYGPGDFFPLTLLLDKIFKLGVYEGPEVYFYEAMTETTVYGISVDEVANSAMQDPLFYKDLLRETGRRLQTTLSSLENLSLQSPYNRLAHQLVFFTNAFGQELKSGIKICVPLTPQDLADVLTINVQNIEKCLSQLEEQSIIKRNKYITITNIKKLREEARG